MSGRKSWWAAREEHSEVLRGYRDGRLGRYRGERNAAYREGWASGHKAAQRDRARVSAGKERG